MGLSFEQVSSSKWAEFHNYSPQRSVFSSVEFMEALESEMISYFLIRKGSENIAGFPALHSNSSIEVPPFSVDAGIHYGALNDLKEHSKSEMRHEVNEIFTQELFARFDKIAFNNHLSVVDLRAFDWFNYSSKTHEGGYEVKVRYTSRLHLVDGSEHFGYSQLRRRDLKNSLAEGARVEPSLAVEELDRLHNLTFKRQGIIRSEKDIKTLIGITSKMLVNGSGKLYLCRIGGQVVSATFWLVGNDVAHYLFGANDPEFRKTGSGTFCMDSAIKEIFKNYGIRTFDFVGINSPNRGSFKLSFGGVVLPYFFVSKIPSAK